MIVLPKTHGELPSPSARGRERRSERIRERRETVRALRSTPEEHALFLERFRVFRAERMNLSDLLPFVSRNARHSRAAYDGSNRSSTELNVQGRSVWMDWVTPTSRAKVIELEIFGLLGQLDTGMASPEEYARSLVESENLEVGQVQYIQFREDFHHAELESHFGSRFLELLEDEGLLDGLSKEGDSKGTYTLRLGAFRIVAGERIDPATLRPAPLQLPHFTKEKLEKLRDRLRRDKVPEPELTEEIGRAHTVSDGITATELSFSLWAIARKAAWLHIPFDRVRILVWTRGLGRAGHYASAYGLKEFDSDPNLSQSEHWMSATLAEILEIQKPSRIQLGAREIRRVAPDRSDSEIAQDLQTLKERVLPFFEVSGPPEFEPGNARFRLASPALDRVVGSFLSERATRPGKVADARDEILGHLEDPWIWGTGMQQSFEEWAAKSLGIEIYASGFDSYLARPELSEKELAALLVALYDRAEKSLGGPAGRFGVILGVHGKAPGKEIEILCRKLGIGLERGKEETLTLHHPDHRFLMVDGKAIARLREQFGSGPNPWVFSRSLLELQRLSLTPGRL
jgi:hypothetical protein